MCTISGFSVFSAEVLKALQLSLTVSFENVSPDLLDP